MKREFENLKSAIAKMLYRSMYKSNYGPSSEVVEVISARTNAANKRALAISLKDKLSDIGTERYCVVTCQNIVSKADSRINMKALDLALSESKPPTNASTRTK